MILDYVIRRKLKNKKEKVKKTGGGNGHGFLPLPSPPLTASSIDFAADPQSP